MRKPCEPCWRCGKFAEVNDGDSCLGPPVCCACYSSTEPAFKECPPNGLNCSVCGLEQRVTWSGATCPNGHGGADGVPMPSDFPTVNGDGWELIQGDCLDVLKTFADESVDACVTDPPAGISFLGKTWDDPQAWDDYRRARNENDAGRDNVFGRTSRAAPEIARGSREIFIAFIQAVMVEVLRVLKPGGHALVWAIPRTSHWTTTAIEDAGFKIRDVIVHLQSQGMPKTRNVGTLIDEAAGAEREVIGLRLDAAKLNKSVQEAPGGWVTGPRVPELTAPATDAAKLWDGFGASLKPTAEFWVLARKPLIGTVVANVLKHGTGVLNVDGCRVATDENLNGGAYAKDGSDRADGYGDWRFKRTGAAGEYKQPPGRWPSNCVFSHAEGCRVVGTTTIKGDPREGGEGTRPGGFIAPGADKGDGKPCGKLYGDSEVPIYECVEGCAVAELDRQSGPRTSGSRKAGVRKGMGYHGADGDGGPAIEGSSGGASRFFPTFIYQAKAPACEKNAGLDERTKHPTIKSLGLLRWLVRLIGGQPGSIILDPFAGSGSTLIAALIEGFKVVGIEKEPEYVEIARRRVEWWLAHPEEK